MAHLKRYAPLLLTLSLLLSACRGDTGDSCSLSSDCPGKQLCHPEARVCVEVSCDGISCFADIAGSPTANEDAAAPEPDSATTNPCEENEVSGWRVTTFEVLKQGSGRVGLDVDGDAATCWPKPCEDGFDNGFEKVSTFNSVFADSISSGDVAMAFVKTEDKIEIYDVEGAVDSGKARVLSASINPDTAEAVSSANADSHEAGIIAASGGFMLLKLLVAGVPLLLPVDALSIHGTLDDSSMDVLIGGAITEKNLEDAVFAVAKEDLPDVIPDNDQLWTTIKILYKVDVDMDGDEEPESISINLRFEGSSADLCFP